MNPKISVVVPIYNVEKYLNQCVESLLEQNYDNYDILLIDDGSSDDSGRISDEFEKKNSIIKAYHKKNGGLSDARNYGLRKSNADYVCFVDSDDIVEKDYLSSMMNNLLTNNVKIAACGMCRLYDDGTKEKINISNIKQKYKGQEAQKYLNIEGYYNVSACNKLFKKELFNTLQFPFGKKSEDWRIMYLLIEIAGDIYFDSSVKYLYRQRMGSITKNTTVNTDAIEAATEVLEYYKKKNWNIAIPFACQSLVLAMIGVYNAYLCRDDKLYYLNKIRTQVRKVYPQMSRKNLSKIRTVQIYMFIYLPFLYDICFKIFNNKRGQKYDK